MKHAFINLAFSVDENHSAQWLFWFIDATTLFCNSAKIRKKIILPSKMFRPKKSIPMKRNTLLHLQMTNSEVAKRCKNACNALASNPVCIPNIEYPDTGAGHPAAIIAAGSWTPPPPGIFKKGPRSVRIIFAHRFDTQTSESLCARLAEFPMEALSRVSRLSAASLLLDKFYSDFRKPQEKNMIHRMFRII